MLLTVKGPVGHTEEAAIATKGFSLGTLFADHRERVETAIVNGRFEPDWGAFIPRKNDRVTLILKTGEPISITIFGVSFTISATVVSTAVSLAVSLSLSMIMQALTPKPRRPKMDGSGSSYGISGYTNTTGQGVPIPVWYGTNRVWPHVIASGVDVSDDGREMRARVLYCVGDAGGDGYGWLGDVEINDVPWWQYEGLIVDYRHGYDPQGAIPEFENTDSLWFVNQPLDWNDSTNQGSSYIYTTKSTQVDRTTLILSFPSGLYRFNSKGQRREEIVDIRIEQSVPNSGNWQVVDGGWSFEYFHFEESIQSQFFRKVMIYHPSRGQWAIRLTVMSSHPFPDAESHGATCALFNAQETTYTTATYPGYVLLSLRNIPAKQVPSLQSMSVSVLTTGKNRKVFDQYGNWTMQAGRERCWTVRDIMTHPICGMGYEFTDADIDDVQWANDPQWYYNETVQVYNQDIYDPSPPAPVWLRDEVRDCCDVGLTSRRWDWDVVKAIAGEGRGRVIPSGDKWKYLVDKPQTPMMLFSEPGNIIEGSIQLEMAPLDRPFNRIIAEFQDEENSYKTELSPPIDGPDKPYPSIIEDAISYETIKRESQVLRENFIALKKQLLERRRYKFTTPMEFLVSEPLDVDWVGERTIGDLGAYSGRVQSGNSQSFITLDQLVELQAATTYLLIIQRKATMTCETQTVLTGAGKWLAVTTTPFSFIPGDGDIYALGEQNVDYIATRCQDLTVGDDGRITHLRTEYLPSVYTDEPIPPKAVRRYFAIRSLPPIPLADAHVGSELVLNLDGSWKTVIQYDVTPGLPIKAGVTGSGFAWSDSGKAVLADTEPTEWWNDNYLVGAEYLALDGANAGQKRKITVYEAGRRLATFDSAMPFANNAGMNYQISWPRYGIYTGFTVEQSQDFTAWSEPTSHLGTHWEKDGGDQEGLWYFRFTPFNQDGVENVRARLIRSVLLAGDRSAPAAPYQVTMAAALKNVSIQVLLAIPIADDLARVDIQLFYWDGVNYVAYRSPIPVGVNRSNISGQFIVVRPTFSLEDVPYYTYIYAWARTADYSDNPSAWVGAAGPVMLTQVVGNDITSGAVSLQQTFNMAGHIEDPAVNLQQVIATVTIQTQGGNIHLWGKTNIDAGGNTLVDQRIYLRQDGVYGAILHEVVVNQLGNSSITQPMLFAIDTRPANPPGPYVYVLTTTVCYAVGGSAGQGASKRQLAALEINK